MKKSYIIIGVVVIVMLVAIGIYAVINSNSQSKKQLEENSTNIEGTTNTENSTKENNTENKDENIQNNQISNESEENNMYSTGKLLGSTNYLTSSGVNVTNSHMMKNIEWGAVAYLKQSNYGLGITDITINNNSSFYTGGGTGTSYKTNTGQSTSGNITGVYDMSGGAYENVMGNYVKTNGSSGLTVSGVPAEHIDIYSGTSVAASHLGDATGETAGWYGDYAGFVNSSNPWFIRGGYYNATYPGVFLFDKSTGGDNYNNSFRVVLSVTK